MFIVPILCGIIWTIVSIYKTIKQYEIKVRDKICISSSIILPLIVYKLPRLPEKPVLIVLVILSILGMNYLVNFLVRIENKERYYSD